MRWREQRLIRVLPGLLVLVGVAAWAGLSVTSAQAARPPVLWAGKAAGIVFAHGNGHGHGPGGGGSSSPNLVDHGGSVMNGTKVTPIYWGDWTSSAAQSTVTGLGTFYNGVGGSAYLGTTSEYGVGTSVTLTSPLYDTSATTRHAPSTSDVLAVVATMTSNNPVSNAYYPVYSDQPRGHASYCAWHSTGKINGITVQFGFFFNLDNDPGCDVSSSPSGQSQDLAALGNVSGHELSEVVTDPHLDAWYDQQGEENADKCAWTFGSSYLTFTNKSEWQIQGNWSNNAYNSGNGDTITATGQTVTGCIDGN